MGGCHEWWDGATSCDLSPKPRHNVRYFRQFGGATLDFGEHFEYRIASLQKEKFQCGKTGCYVLLSPKMQF